MCALATPMIDHGKLDQGNGQLLHHDVLKHPHERKLVTNFKANVVTEERIKQFESLVFVSRSHVGLLSSADIPVCHSFPKNIRRCEVPAVIFSSFNQIYRTLRKEDSQECLCYSSIFLTAASRRLHSSTLPSSSNQSRTLSATVNPISGTSSSSSTVALLSASSEPNCRARVVAVRSPTWRSPNA